MWGVGLAALLLLTTVGVADAQYWGSPYGRGGYGYYERPSPNVFSPFWGWDGDNRPRRYVPEPQLGGGRARVAGPRRPERRSSRPPSRSRAAIRSAASSSTARAASCSWSNRRP